jgi:predicted RNase H-like HicB family nuclease
MKYAVVIEEGPKSYGAYAPDLPGCGVAGSSRAEVMDLIQEAVSVHLAGLKEDGLEIPAPSTIEFVDVAA